MFTGENLAKLLCLSLALCLLATAGCTLPTETRPEAPKEGNQKVAIDFLRNSPTFRFDGIEKTLKLSEAKEGWQFCYEFQCRHAGYGDRTGLILAQVITDHKAEIVVDQGEVARAVLDGRWDMLRQKILK